jgi:hypothetical protein
MMEFGPRTSAWSHGSKVLVPKGEKVLKVTCSLVHEHVGLGLCQRRIQGRLEKSRQSSEKMLPELFEDSVQIKLDLVYPNQVV